MAVERLLHWLARLAAVVGIAPAFVYLDPLAQTLSLLALVAGGLAEQRRKRLLTPLSATLLSFAGFFFYLLQMSGGNIVAPLLNMLTVLLGVRLMTEKSGRNLLQIFVLATFVLAASSLFSLSAFYLLCLTLLIVLVTFGLLLTSFYVTDPGLRLTSGEWRSLLKTGALLPAGSLLLMFFFFTLLPRTEHPLWNFLNPRTQPAAGFSEEVRPGELSNLGHSGEAAFRAETAPIPPQNLYWRGLVLNQTDGRNWSRDKTPPRDILTAPNPTTRDLTIYAEPRTDRYLPGPDLTIRFSGVEHQGFADGVSELKRRPNKRMRYQTSYTQTARLKLKNRSDSDYYLQVPTQVSPRVRTIAEQIARQPNRAAKISATSKFFHQQKLRYAARNLQPSENPVDFFLFESRRGYCEYFASSYALLLRLAEVPARLVGGYLGGRYSKMGGYYLVDEDMAHVWVEVLDDQNRWQRIDPSRLAINAEEAVTGLARLKLDGSQAAFDYLDVAWSRLVITYDLHRQFALVFALGRNLRALKPVLSGGYFWWLGAAALLIGLLRLRLHRFFPRHREKDKALLNSYLRQICRLSGQDRLPPALGLRQLAEHSGEPLCAEFAQIYGVGLYGEKPLSNADRQRLRQIVRELRGKKEPLDLRPKNPND